MKTSALFKSSLKSYSAQTGEIWDVHSVTETYLVQRVDGNFMRPNDVSTIPFETGAGAPVIPKIGDLYQYPTGGLGTSQLEFMRCRSHSWAQPEGLGMQVQVRYETRYFYATNAKGMTAVAPGSNTGLGGENWNSATVLDAQKFLPCELLPVFQSRNVKLYRDNPSMTGPSPGLDISTADIGGSEKLIDQDVRQVGMKLRLVFDCYATPILASSAVTGMLDKVTSLLGTKNQYTFLGYGAGNLVATGASINHLEGEFYELVLETLYDEYFHHSQFAVNASDGRPDMTTSGGVGKYKTVYWARPVRTQADFNSIWPANDIGKNQKYQAYTGRWY